MHCQTKVPLQEAEFFLFPGDLRKLNAVHALSNFVRVNEPLDLFWISSGSLPDFWTLLSSTFVFGQLLLLAYSDQILQQLQRLLLNQATFKFI
jgi:hypothetical protein